MQLIEVVLDQFYQLMMLETPFDHFSEQVFISSKSLDFYQKKEEDNKHKNTRYSYSRRHKKVPVPYSYYDRKTLRSVKRYDPITVQIVITSPIYSVIARFLRVNNAPA